MKQLLYTLIASFLLICSCQKDENEQPVQNEQKEQENKQEEEYVDKPILIFPIEGGCETVCMKRHYTFWSVVEVYEHVNDTIILRSPRSKDYKGEWYSVTICEDNPQKLIVTCEENTKHDLRELGITVQHANIFPTIFVSQASYPLDK